MQERVKTKVIMLAIVLIAAALALFVSLRTEDYSKYFEVKNTYPHNIESFTEGLFFYNNKLYESTGLENKSKMLAGIELETGKAAFSRDMDSNIFGEGSCVLNGKLYMLSWTEGKAFVMNPDTLEVEKILDYERDGWGLTTDGTHLYASDGSSTIYEMDENLQTIRTITVRQGLKKIENLNELEYLDGKIWANVWLEDCIVRIDAASGKVEKSLNFGDLVPEGITDINSVLNGIAAKDGRLYITGKNWPVLYELEFRNSR